MRNLHLSDADAWLDDPPASDAPGVSLADIRVGSACYERSEGDLETQDRRRGGVVVKVEWGYDDELANYHFHTVSIRDGKLTYHTLRADQVDPETIDRLDRVQCRQIVRWCAREIGTTTHSDETNAKHAALIATLTEALVGPGWSGE